MLAVHTTVVAVVAPPGSDPLRGAQAANVRVVRPAAELAGLERAQAAWEAARRTNAPYLLHDADPLAVVAGAWTALYDGAGAAGELEVATAEVLARWRARSLELPDYYLVVDPESLVLTLQHWYFGVLAGRAPARVVASRPAAGVVEQLPGLRAGAWWPPLDRLLGGVEGVVPDRAGVLGAPSGGPAELRSEPDRVLAPPRGSGGPRRRSPGDLTARPRA